MSYQVLARKWRPKNFTEMVGQEHVRRALINALDSQRLHHAYLFTGTRGVGKTTIARILAKSLNCEQGISSTPCSSCATCVDIDQGRFVDLLEVDAASRTKVEDTREILDNVQYAPSRGRYKVYLIDEVHMLSTSSFNALLKTLEEPPEHVKFLLATTDPQKLPATVLSRCLQFNLLRMDIKAIEAHLQHILTSEQIEFAAPALKLIARSADGSMRDALSLLDQAIAFGAGKVEFADVAAMLGTLANSELFALIEKLIAADGAGLMQQVANLAANNINFANLINELLLLLHQLALVKRVPTAADENLYDASLLNELAGKISEADLQLYYQIALIGKRDLPLAYDAKSGFEMLMLRMLAFAPQDLATSAKKPAAAEGTKPLAAPVVETTAANKALAASEPAPNSNSLPINNGNNRQRRQQLRAQNQLIGSANNADVVPITSTAPNTPQVVDIDDINQALAEACDKNIAVADVVPITSTASKSPQVVDIEENITAISENNVVADVVVPITSTTTNTTQVVDIDKNNAASAPSEPANKTNYKLNPHLIDTAVADSSASATWLQLLERLPIGGIELQILHNSVLLARENNLVQLRLRSNCANLVGDNLATRLQNIEQALSDYLGSKQSVELAIGDGGGETFSERNQRIYGERHEQAISSIMHDPVVQDLQKLFAATINPKYIKPLELENQDERPTR